MYSLSVCHETYLYSDSPFFKEMIPSKRFIFIDIIIILRDKRQVFSKVISNISHFHGFVFKSLHQKFRRVSIYKHTAGHFYLRNDPPYVL